MRIPDKFAQTYKELVRSLRREARDNLKLASLKKPIAITLGEKYRLMAEIENNIADSIVAMWRRERKSAKPLRNCDVGTVAQQAKRFAEYCESEVCKRNRCKSRAKVLCIERCALAWAQLPYVEKKGGAK